MPGHVRSPGGTGLGPALGLYEVYHGIVSASPDPAAGTSADAAAGASADPGPLRVGIELHDVWFRYHADRDWVLRGANLTLPVGTSTALVGLNGAGKSTLVKLICRMYEPELGTITWDGTDIRLLDPEALRRRVGVLFQDYMTYAMTAGENIGEGGPVSNTTTAIAAMVVGLTKSMLAEVPPNDGHRRNILSPDFHHIGIAVMRDGSGTVWLTQDFSD